MKGLFKNKIYIVLLLVISFISHWYIFFDLKILNWGDWVYYFNSQFSTIFSFNIYYSSFNLGTISAFSNNWVFYLIGYFLGLFGLTWDVFTRIIFLIPIVFFTPLFSFLLFRKIFKNDLIAFFSACIYSFNTFFLKLQLDWITHAFIWWVLPALFLSILNYLETKKNKYLIYNVLLVFLGFVYELRIMILVLVFLSLFQIIYLIFNNKPLKIRIKNNFYILISFFLGVLGHAFWLIPLKFSNILGEVVNNTSASPFISFYDLLGVLTLHTYNWSQNLVLENFIKQPIEFRHFLIPLVALVGIINSRKLFKEKKDALYFIFFAIALIFFVFLGKQAFGPFKNFYNWAFYNIPLFNLYRESSKFFILIALSLAFFFGPGLFYVYKTIKKHSVKIALFAVMIILFFSSVFNLQHFIDQKIGGMTKGKMINDDYIKLEKILSADLDFYRILWMPVKARFGFYSDEHPFLNAIDLTKIFKDQVGFIIFNGSWPVYSQLLFPLQQNYSDQLLDDMAVKYVILPVVEKRFSQISATEIKTVNEIYEHYGEREYFINGLDKLSYLKKIDIGTDELVVYENDNYKPHFYVPQNIVYSNGRLENLADIVNIGNYNVELGIYLIENENLLNKVDGIFVKGELENKITEEELKIGGESKEVFFPYTRQKPGSLFYPLVLKKEEYDKWKVRKEPEKLFEKQLFYASKRISEIMAFGVNELVLVNYKKEMTDALGILGNLKSENDKDFVKLLAKYEGTLWGQREKIKEIENLTDWDNAFQELEGQVEVLKVKRDFSKLVYNVEVPKTGEYEIFIDENGEKKNLGKKDFEKGIQELVFPIKEISENLIDEDLQIKDYLSDSIYKISFDYQAFDKINFFVKENDSEEIAKTNLFPTGNEFESVEMYFKSSPEATSAAVRFSDLRDGNENYSKLRYKNLQVQQILQPNLILKSVEPQTPNLIPQIPKITFVKINPTKYRVKVEGAKEPYTLIFSESFHQGWKAYINQNQNSNIKIQNYYGEEIASYFNDEIKEVTYKNILLDKNTFETWGKKPLPEDKHSLVNGYANSWYITPEDAGGRQDYELIIEFAPQKLFYLGLFISILTLVGCLGYLIINLFRKIFRKK